MIGGIKFRTMFSTWRERHAFLIGLFEVLCPWRPRQRPSTTVDGILDQEYHYYLAGRAAGLPVLLLILIALAKLIEEVLL